LHNKKDADDIRAGVDGLLWLAGSSGTGSAAQNATGHQQRPLQIRDARDAEADTGDLEVEYQGMQMSDVVWCFPCMYVAVMIH
jgi:hypothetical protein